MSVSVRIPTILRTYTGGESEVSADGATLAYDENAVTNTNLWNHYDIEGDIAPAAGK